MLLDIPILLLLSGSTFSLGCFFGTKFTQHLSNISVISGWMLAQEVFQRSLESAQRDITNLRQQLEEKETQDDN